MYFNNIRFKLNIVLYFSRVYSTRRLPAYSLKSLRHKKTASILSLKSLRHKKKPAVSFKRQQCYKNIWTTSFKEFIYEKAGIVSFKML
jgi:hypothetical protein